MPTDRLFRYTMAAATLSAAARHKDANHDARERLLCLAALYMIEFVTGDLYGYGPHNMVQHAPRITAARFTW